MSDGGQLFVTSPQIFYCLKHVSIAHFHLCAMYNVNYATVTEKISFLRMSIYFLWCAVLHYDHIL